MAAIKDEVRDYIMDNFLMGVDGTRLGDDTSFLDLGILDSTGVIELITFLEEKYGIHVEDEEMIPDNLDSLNGITRFVVGKTAPVAVDAALTACS